MSEEINNENQQETKEEIKEEIKETENYNSKVLKYVLILAVIFLGTFAAVYTIIDMNMHKLGMTPFFVTFQEAQKLFDSESKYMAKSSPAPVKIETNDDKYTVTVDLKNFDNNPENIDIETTERGIKINGMYKKTKDGEVKESSFYQNVIFPNEIDNEKTKKEIKGNKIIITLPFVQKET